MPVQATSKPRPQFQAETQPETVEDPLFGRGQGDCRHSNVNLKAGRVDASERAAASDDAPSRAHPRPPRLGGPGPSRHRAPPGGRVGGRCGGARAVAAPTTHRPLPRCHRASCGCGTRSSGRRQHSVRAESPHGPGSFKGRNPPDRDLTHGHLKIHMIPISYDHNPQGVVGCLIMFLCGFGACCTQMRARLWPWVSSRCPPSPGCTLCRLGGCKRYESQISETNGRRYASARRCGSWA